MIGRSILVAERDTYDQMWAIDAYATLSPGVQYLPLFLDAITAHEGPLPRWHASSVLDAGTGSGKGALALRAAGLTVTLCDLTDAGLVDEARDLPFHVTPLWEPLRRIVGWHDWVYCCDVLEHIPPPFTMLVVSRLLEVARKGVFLSISLQPDAFGAWIGKPLHQSVQSFSEWRDQLATIGTVLEARDLLTVGVYLVQPHAQ
jgi:SAM-dependent methyltransferase